MADINDFQKLDIRLGKIKSVELIPGAKFTTHKMVLDFGKEIGEKKSCARLINYQEKELIGKQILGIINLPPRQIGPAVSEVLTLGIADEKGECILIKPDKEAQLGAKLY